MRFKNTEDAASYISVLGKTPVFPNIDAARLSPIRKRELVAGGDPVRVPVDRTAAIVTSKAPWWAELIPKKEEKKKVKVMSKAIHTTDVQQVESPNPNSGILVRKINGIDMVCIDDMYKVICEQIEKFPKHTSPLVKQAEEARQIIDELLHGIGGEMERFKEEVPEKIQSLRSLRYTVVSEVGAMSTALKDVRQFFLGADHKEHITRLREFVELCERLKALKDCGFLDTVADTIIKLDRQ